MNWKLSERPLLLMITSLQDAKRPVAQISVLTPAFEASRAKSLHIPSESGFPVRYIEWPEDASPYIIASSVIPKDATTIFVDSSVRKFIADGFQNALPNAVVLSAPEEITEVRERIFGYDNYHNKSATFNLAYQATLHAIRAVHKHLYVGIRESEARSFMATALASVGLKNGGCLTLFGEHTDIWNRVRKAQTIALQAAHSGALTRTVDEAARQFLASEGYAQYFTHRLGHGIGLEVHEEPYLRGASNVVIKSGHTFSNEPGIYIEGKVGVRLEDCFVIGEDGAPILLTAGAGGQSISPWAP
ncbi:hypothetical protein H0H93_015089 [Arthromyces matolae]|nr:hypothetical protein H0H93_015089 [Arthromyces matolae]